MPKKGAAKAGGGAKAFELKKLPAYKQAKQLLKQDEYMQAAVMYERALKNVPDEHDRDRAECDNLCAVCHGNLQ